jgi:hypothetical protein
MDVDAVEQAVERFYMTIQLELEQIDKLRDHMRDELAQLRKTRGREAKTGRRGHACERAPRTNHSGPESRLPCRHERAA